MKILISSVLVISLYSCSQENKQADMKTPIKMAAVKNELELTDSQITLANITTQVVRAQPIGQTLIVNARLVANEELTEVISARAVGRIEKLFVKEVGRSIRQGEPLYVLYSETLLTMQKEYVLALEQYTKLKEIDSRYEEYLKSARKKLLLYGLTDEQIDRLNGSDDLQPRITFLATATGIVKEINVTEGQYLNEGDLLYQLENLRQLWVEAELYPSELQNVQIGDRISLQIAGSESSIVEASIIFLTPEYRSNTQITVLRAALNNATLQWKPGMQAQVFLNQIEKSSLAIPTGAVIHEQRGAHVFIKMTDHTFIPRMVTTGLTDFNFVEITDGLMEGEVVVISGAYLLYSELILKQGSDPMMTHNH